MQITKILLVFGTRPEAIKMAPLYLALKRHTKNFEVLLCVTGQHKEMLYQVLDLFEIKPDFDLEIMETAQTLNKIVASFIVKLKEIFDDERPGLIFVHGDTATSFAAALSAFFNKIPVGHIEAGLRTGNILSPWPEEANRKLISTITKYHFSPTEIAKQNLMLENVDPACINVTGNTVIDALFLVRKKLEDDYKLQKKLLTKFNYINFKKKYILVTGRRRENFGDGFEKICVALQKISQKYPDVQIVYPVHLNPNVQEPVNRLLGGKDNIFLIKPVDYLSFVYLMLHSYFIMTDSGGIQEEATSLGKPVLVMRDTTERPEALASGNIKLVGTDVHKIVNNIENLLEDDGQYSSMSGAKNFYGEGKACEQIIDILINL